MILRSDQISNVNHGFYTSKEEGKSLDCTLIATMQRELTKNAPKVALK